MLIKTALARRGNGSGIAGVLLRVCMLAALILATATSRAEAPDPVRFGVAIEAGHTERARAWLESGLDPDFLADRIGTGLMIGAWEGNIEMMALFLAHGADVNQVNDHNEQALQLAAWKGRLDAVKWLLARGATLNREPMEWGALHYAVFAGHRDIARFLIEQGADVNARIPNGSTVLMMAAREGHEDLAGTLIDAGADPRLANERGESALIWAMRHGHFKLAQRVSAPAEFAQAVQAPPESFGKPTRSLPAPPEIAQLLQQLRAAEARGQQTASARQALFDAVARFKKDSRPAPTSGAARAKSRGTPVLVITAERQRAGAERAELVYDAPQEKAATAPVRSDVGQLMRALRLAQAQGRPVDGVREALLEAVANARKDTGPAPMPGPPTRR